jgi:hypothetical protein
VTYLKAVRPRTVIVDVLNVARRGWPWNALISYDHFMDAVRSLKAWAGLGAYCDVRFVGDPELLDVTRVADRPKFERLVEQGWLYLAPKGQKADLTVLALAKGTDGIVVAEDEYRKEYHFGHEWLLFDLKRAVKPICSKRRWRWEWKDLEGRLQDYYGKPDEPNQVMSRRYIREIEADTGFSFRDPRWPGVGEPVGFPHMARDLCMPVHVVRRKAVKLGIPDALSTYLTDEQVMRLRADCEERQQAVPLPKAA